MRRIDEWRRTKNDGASQACRRKKLPPNIEEEQRQVCLLASYTWGLVGLIGATNFEVTLLASLVSSPIFGYLLGYFFTRFDGKMLKVNQAPVSVADGNGVKL